MTRIREEEDTKNVECENTELISYACCKLMIVLSKLFV